jgi:glycosyltransferase involved in cell wall biosynthesis
MKLLYVTVAVPPVKGGSVIITENLVKQFSANEMVVLGANHIFSFRRRSEQKTNGIRYYYQPTELNINGRGDRFFLPLRYLFFPFLVWRICHVFKKEKCTYILANFPDIYYCYAALLASRILNVKFSSYFHNTYLENRPKGHMRFFAKHWQPQIFSRSQNIFVMSDGMKSHYQTCYPEHHNFVALPHSHNVSSPLTMDSTPRSLKPPYKLVLIGNFNESNIDATRRFVDAVKDDDNYKIFFYTSVPNFLLKMRGIDVEYITNKGYIDDNKLLAELQQYDVCILTHGFGGGYTEIEYRTIFPTRTIPFLLSGKPILVHSPPASFLNKFIKEYKCGSLVEVASEQKIRIALSDIVRNASMRAELVENALIASRQFEGKIIASKLKYHLNEA